MRPSCTRCLKYHPDLVIKNTAGYTNDRQLVRASPATLLLVRGASTDAISPAPVEREVVAEAVPAERRLLPGHLWSPGSFPDGEGRQAVFARRRGPLLFLGTRLWNCGGLTMRDVAGHFLEEAFGRVADEESFQSRTGQGAHDDDVGVRPACDLANHLGRQSAHEITARAGNVGSFQQRLELPPGLASPPYLQASQHAGIDRRRGRSDHQGRIGMHRMQLPF